MFLLGTSKAFNFEVRIGSEVGINFGFENLTFGYPRRNAFNYTPRGFKPLHRDEEVIRNILMYREGIARNANIVKHGDRE